MLLQFDAFYSTYNTITLDSILRLLISLSLSLSHAETYSDATYAEIPCKDGLCGIHFQNDRHCLNYDGCLKNMLFMCKILIKTARCGTMAKYHRPAQVSIETKLKTAYTDAKTHLQ